MKILVTGGLGYVGSVAAQFLLERGHEIRIIDDGRDSVADGHFDRALVIRQPIGTVDPATIRNFGPDVVMHFAGNANLGYGESRPLEYLDNHVSELGRFMSAVLQSDCRLFINSGSSSVYGDPAEPPYVEEHLPNPSSWYGWTKLMAERLVTHLGTLKKLRYVAFRYFNAAGAAYGIVEKRKVEDHLIPRALTAVEERRVLEVYGRDWPTPDGTCVRDYVHVLDLAEAHLFAAQALVEGKIEGEVMNLGSGYGFSVWEVARTIESVTERPLPLIALPRRPGDSPVRVASIRKARLRLDWAPRRSLRQMIQDAWAARRSRDARPGLSTPGR